MPNVSHSVMGSPTATSGTATVTILAAQGAAKVFAHAFLFNPSGSGAGQWSDDNFVNNIFPFAAGPSCTRMFDAGSVVNPIKVRRTTATDVSNAVVALF